VVESAEELEPPVGQVARQVSRAIEALSRIERVLDESLGCELGPVEISPSEPDAADEQLARDADRERLQPLVEHVQRRIPQRPPDRHPVPRPHSDRRRPDRRLRRPVHVPELDATEVELVDECRRQRFASTESPEPLVTLPTMVDEHAPGRRGGLHDGCAVLLEQRRELRRVARRLGRREHDPATADEREIELEPRDVERKRRDGEKRVLGGEARLEPDARQEVDERAVRNLYTLGRSGRARRVDHIGEILLRDGGDEGILRLLGDLRPLAVEHHELSTCPRQAPEELRLGHDDRSAGVLEHEREALRGILRVERDVCTSRLQDAEQRDQERRRALHADPHEGSGRDAQPDEMTCDLIRPSFQLGVRQRLCPRLDRNPLWRPRRLPRHELVNAGERDVGGRRVPFDENLPELELAHVAKTPDLRLRRSRTRGGKSHDVGQDAASGDVVEEVGIEVESEVHRPGPPLLHLERERERHPLEIPNRLGALKDDDLGGATNHRSIVGPLRAAAADGEPAMPIDVATAHRPPRRRARRSGSRPSSRK